MFETRPLAGRGGLYGLRRGGGSDPDPEVAQQNRVVREEDGGRLIVCRTCGHPITSEAARLAVRGQHEHRCVNPSGILFHIGCFRSAPGCRDEGPPTFDFTWFAGFAWNYALCRSCTTLIGWRYQGEGGGFFGLILDRLAETGR